MTYKYSKEHESRKDQPCPCSTKFSPNDLVGFRFLENKVPKLNDFIPPAIMSGGPKDSDRCSRLALSFFIDLKSAREKFDILNKRGNYSSKYEYIGELVISKDDGSTNNPNESGHFDLHEFLEVDFLSKEIKVHPLEKVTSNA